MTGTACGRCGNLLDEPGGICPDCANDLLAEAEGLCERCMLERVAVPGTLCTDCREDEAESRLEDLREMESREPLERAS